MVVVGNSLVMPYTSRVVRGATLRMQYNTYGRVPQRTSKDALRSLHKYVAMMLPDEWEVRLWDEEGSFARPFARVARIGPALPSGPAIYTDVVQTMTVHCYPQEQQTVEAGLLVAEDTEELLFQGFRIGVPPGAPLRVPLWDWYEQPLDGPDSDSTYRRAHDYMRIVPASLSFTRLHDPVDDRLITVVTDLRLTWRRPGRSSIGKPVSSVVTELTPEG